MTIISIATNILMIGFSFYLMGFIIYLFIQEYLKNEKLKAIAKKLFI
jgi:hypothetical protein